MKDANKWSHHVTRCGDKIGKAEYRCQYNDAHFRCSAKDICEHEQFCQFRKAGTAINLERRPSLVYCQYQMLH